MQSGTVRPFACSIPRNPTRAPGVGVGVLPCPPLRRGGNRGSDMPTDLVRRGSGDAGAAWGACSQEETSFPQQQHSRAAGTGWDTPGDTRGGRATWVGCAHGRDSHTPPLIAAARREASLSMLIKHPDDS